MYVRLSARSVRRTRELEPGLLADSDARVAWSGSRSSASRKSGSEAPSRASAHAWRERPRGSRGSPTWSR